MRVAVFPPKGTRFPSGSPWDRLLEGIVEAGAEAAQWAEALPDPTAIVALNSHEAVEQSMSALALAPRDCALVVLEPVVTAPRMYTGGVRRRYGHVFAASALWARRLHGEAFLWPQEIAWEDVGDREGDVASVLINADKRSAVHGSLYGLRRKVIQTFDERGLKLDLFGRGWSSGFRRDALEGSKAVGRALLASRTPDFGEAYGDVGWKPAQWKGAVDRKTDAFRGGNVGVVIENSADYVSEKLFDVIRHGLVAVYVGPPLKEFGVPDDMAVLARTDPNHIADVVSALSLNEIQARVDRARAWLTSEAALMHDQAAVLHDLGVRLGRALIAR